MYESGKLKTPLGPLIQTYKKWKAYYNDMSNVVYVYDNHWYKHPVLQAARSSLEFSREDYFCAAQNWQEFSNAHRN
eukprot:15366464-Ditylum_brightwellii.AAC.1